MQPLLVDELAELIAGVATVPALGRGGALIGGPGDLEASLSEARAGAAAGLGVLDGDGLPIKPDEAGLIEAQLRWSAGELELVRTLVGNPGAAIDEDGFDAC